MKNQGFTLIELLVVVLILGILVAIAVPKYQRSIVQTKYNALKFYSRSLAEANDRYYLANGHYSIKITDLDISYAIEFSNLFGGDSAGNSVNRIKDGITCNINDYVETGGKEMRNVACWVYVYGDLIMSYYHPYAQSSCKRECWAYSLDTNDMINSICQTETGKKTPDWQYMSKANVYYY